MKRIVTAFILALFVVGVASSATDTALVQSVRDKIDEVQGYAQQFENGDINYLQLRVYTSYIRESVNRMLGNKHFEMSKEEEFYEGLTEEDVESIFGEPTDQTRWVWVENKHESVMLDEPIPRWEETIYDGTLIKITINAWPHMLEFSDGSIVNYYHVGFDVRFKQQFSVDFSAMMDTLNTSISSYLETGVGKEEVIDLMVSYEQTLMTYLEENKGDCKEIMGEWFSASEYVGQEKTVTWEATVYRGTNLNMMVHVNTCPECDWPWVHLNAWPEFFGPMFMEETMFVEPDRESYRGMTVQQLYSELESAIADIVSVAGTLDAGESADFEQLNMRVMAINDVLNEKLYERTNEDARQDKFRERMNHLESVLLRYTSSIFKEERRNSRYERIFIKNETLHEDRWCRHTNDIYCEPGYGCYDATCVSTFGGAEGCANSIDDDTDGKIDCEDPDCEDNDNCLCERSNCLMWPNRECHIITGTLRSGGDITKISATKDENNLYLMMQMKQMTNPTDVSYHFHVWNQELQKGYGLSYDSEGMWMWSDIEGDVDTTGIQVATGNIIEVKIPFSKIGDSNNFWIDGSTTDRETWVNLDHTDRGLALETRHGSVTVDGMFLDWEGIPASNDRRDDMKTKDAHCWCKEGWSDCDWDWENGCESNQPCAWEIEHGCGWNQHMEQGECFCDEGWFDCDFDGNCESEGGCSEVESSYNEEVTYVCNGVESTVPCDQRTQECGMNQFLDEMDGLCYCIKGFYDCNSDGDCLDTKACNMILETCDNGYDDDADNLADCADLQDCPDGSSCLGGACVEGECVGYEVIYEEVPEPEPPTEPPTNETEQGGGLTGAAVIPYLKFALEGCSSDQDCGPGMVCDIFSGECFCEWGYFDCNNDRSDGCESTDATCGGRFDPCAEQHCKEHQTCNPMYGFCECDQGWNDCDGDWENGCDSTSQCVPCQTDADCATDRCSVWGDDTIHQFGCYADSSWYEESGRIQVEGSCEVKSSGEIHGWIHIGGWGETYNELFREKEMKRSGMDWCEKELNSSITERMLIQGSLDSVFMSWFFNDFVSSDPDQWQTHIGGIFETYWRLVDNTMRVASALECLGISEWPSEYQLISVSYDSPYGSIEIWEEWVTTDFFSREFGGNTGSRRVPTPYMKAWIFPPKEVFKQEIHKGPPEGEEGPTPAEVQEMQNNTAVMDTINMISSWFGGSADFLFNVVDGDEVVFQALMTINPEVIMQMNMDPGSVTPDLVMTASYDWFYDMVLTMEREFRGDTIESPPWDHREQGFGLKEFNTMNTMFSKIFYAIRVGEITVTPMEYTFFLLQAMQGLSSLMGLAMS